ncbi:hypothetical protein D917_05699 [Trichinella nativa]|uniref:Uncharacterized protein n=1 Tax=Trichinella nativa TaxID=6335 RepID=A0A1Y3F090_9BILA|nr:hypothetical protein D917_05699 [Trichinella nativa]
MEFAPRSLSKLESSWQPIQQCAEAELAYSSYRSSPSARTSESEFEPKQEEKSTNSKAFSTLHLLQKRMNGKKAKLITKMANVMKPIHFWYNSHWRREASLHRPPTIQLIFHFCIRFFFCQLIQMKKTALNDHAECHF